MADLTPERSSSEARIEVGEHECVTCARCATTFAAVHPACPSCSQESRLLSESSERDEHREAMFLDLKEDFERREKALREALEDQRRRWNRHSTRLTMAGVNASGRDMDDAVNAIDAALAGIAGSPSEKPVSLSERKTGSEEEA